MGDPPDTLDHTVGQRVAAQRHRQGLTQRALAARLGWAAGTLANFEVGRRRLTVGQLAELAAALDTVPAVLLATTPTTAAVLEQIEADAQLAEQVAYFLRVLNDPVPPSPAGRTTRNDSHE